MQLSNRKGYFVIKIRKGDEIDVSSWLVVFTMMQSKNDEYSYFLSREKEVDSVAEAYLKRFFSCYFLENIGSFP